MEKLELNQMEQIEGGGWKTWACAGVGAAISVAATPWVGMPVGFACASLADPTPAY